MASRRLSGAGVSLRNNNRSCSHRGSIICLLSVSVIAPLMILALRTSANLLLTGQSFFSEESVDPTRTEELARRRALEAIEAFFPTEVLELISLRSEESGTLGAGLTSVERKDLSSSWVREEGLSRSSWRSSKSYLNRKGAVGHGVSAEDSRSRDNLETEDSETEQSGGREERENNNKVRTSVAEVGAQFGVDKISKDGKQEVAAGGGSVVANSDRESIQQHIQSKEDELAKLSRKKLRLERHYKRLSELMQQDEEKSKKLEAEAIQKSKEVDTSITRRYSIWRPESVWENPDALVRLMRDQLIMARVYANIAQAKSQFEIVQDLKFHIKEHACTIGDANADIELPKGADEKMKLMGQLLAQVREQHYEAHVMVNKLRAMLHVAEDNVHMLKTQSTYMSQVAAKTVPKGLHCLSMSLTVDFHSLPFEQHEFAHQERLEDPNLYHYALFSDNILAASVVVASTIINAKEPEKHVFHVVTDKLNFGAMKMWFLTNLPGVATIQVQNVDDFRWLNASYSPVLRQLESAAMRDFYFKSDHSSTLSTGMSNLKYRNPKYLSMLNHLRFYLPEVFPKLDKILFLDDDIVVQKDLTPLWTVDLKGNVNGAVETCGASFHRFDKYLNFSNPLISSHFSPDACGWAYGMNVFDLKEWKKRDITGIYHRWQSLNEDRELWKLGTLPPGLITFYNLTHPLEKSWHVLGLGYNPAVEDSEIKTAAVIHYNGNLKPWLEIAMTKFKPYWSKFVKNDNPYLQQCNINY